MDARLDESGLVKGRECGSCSMCCKVLRVDWFEPVKEAGKWCQHCRPGKGCAIWDTRPQQCGAWHCNWRKNPELGDQWRPDRSGFLINRSALHMPFEVIVDPSKPDSWRKEPYYSVLKRAAAALIAEKSILVVQIGARQILMLPDNEVPVPKGLENTDFRIEPDPATGRLNVRFLAAQV